MPITIFTIPNDTKEMSQFFPDVTLNENTKSEMPIAMYNDIRKVETLMFGS